MAKRTIVKYTVEVSVVENAPDPQAPLANNKMFLYSVQAQPGEARVEQVEVTSPEGEKVKVGKATYDLPPLTYNAQSFGVGDAMDKASAAVYEHLQRLGAHK